MLLYNKVMKNVTRKGKKMARRAGFQINREDIIRAAIKQISKYGFSNFTLSNLSKELNITKAALYWHFKSKNDILMEVLKYIELEYISKISEICDDKSLSASEKLKNYLTFVYEKSESDVHLCVIPSKLLGEFLHKDSEFHEEIREIYANYKESIAKILIDGIIEGDFKKNTSPIDHARFIVGSIDGILQQYISDHTQVHKVFNSGEKFSEYVMTLFV